MKKLESSLKNMLLVLTIVTMVAVGLLAYVNELTKAPIAEANMKTLNAALENVLPEYTNNPVAECDSVFSKGEKKVLEYIIYPAKKGDQWVGSAVESKSLGFSGEIKILVGFDANGDIYDYSLLSHSETPGLGSKADVWFKEGNKGSIKGLNPGKEELAVKNDGGKIDAITASTITSRAFLKAVNDAYKAYKGENVDTSTSASQKVSSEAETDTNTAATEKATDGNTSATKHVEQTDSTGTN